jgi:hypothetical protein
MPSDVLFLTLESLTPLAIFPFNSRTRGRDIGRRRNPSARLVGVRPAPGPDGKRRTSYQFFGKPKSYIEIPNNGGIDPVNSISILLWVYTQGKPGPIVNFHPAGFGMHIWMVSRTALFVRFPRRRGRVLTKVLLTKRMEPNKWKFVGATYNRRTEYAEVYIDGKRVVRKRIGKIHLATNYPIRLGSRKGDTRRFKGRIACLQIYNTALNAKQIRARKNVCFGRGKFSFFYIYFIFCVDIRKSNER